jgi:ATP-dependent DNA helicase PIF1
MDDFGFGAAAQEHRQVQDTEGYASLSTLQKHCFDLIRQRKSVLISGPAGTGKSHLIKFVCQELSDANRSADRMSSRKIAVTGSTGIAGANVLGHTIHSWSGIWLANEPFDHIVSRCSGGKFKRRWRRTDLLIIDEISMLEARLLQLLDHLGRVIRHKPSLPFGGMQVVLVGDAMQLPPVRKTDDPEDHGQYFFKAKCFDELVLPEHRIELDVNFRQATDPAYAAGLNRLRLGELTPDFWKLLRSRVGEPTRDDVMLYAKNVDVDQENEDALEDIDEPKHAFEHTFEIFGFMAAKAAKKLERRMLKDCRASVDFHGTMFLKKGARVIHVTNDSNTGLVNGSQGTVVGFHEKYGNPIVEFDSLMDAADAKNRVVMMPWTWEAPKENPGDAQPPPAKLRQYPLKLAFALTGHKCQGMTLNRVFIQFSDIFEDNQAYVMLSRVRTSKGLTIGHLSKSVIGTHPEALAFTRKLIANSAAVAARVKSATV